MPLYTLIFSLFLIISLSCNRWEYDDPSIFHENEYPETYLSLIASDTIFAHYDSTDGEYTYAIDEEPSPGIMLDTLDYAFTTITTSVQQLHWWGEDKDGSIIGYKYKWSSDTSWTYTTEEDGLFYVPIRTDLDVFSFEVKAIDNHGLEDQTTAELTLPIKNSAPEINFRYNSNPKVYSIQGDTSLTFPVRTFVWDLYDQDGLESVAYIYYALDDTCDTCWIPIDEVSSSSLTLTEIEPGFHVFYLKAEDVAGAESNLIFFPDTTNNEEPDYWKVIPVKGDLLLVNDFVQDSQNNAMTWYKSVLDTLVGENNYSVWKLGRELPYSSNDTKANLGYFKNVFWNSAYTGISLYNDASASITNYVLNGGNFFISVADVKDTSFTWFPIDSIIPLTGQYAQISSNVTLYSQVDSTLDLRTDDEQGIYLDLEGFENEDDPNFRSLYRLQLPEDQFDEWVGTPNVCGVYQYQYPLSAGKAVLLSLPVHNGYAPLLDGNSNYLDFLNYLINVEFSE